MTEKTYTPEEQKIIDDVKDRMRGYPRQHLEDVASNLQLTCDELIAGLHKYIDSKGEDMIDDHFEGPDDIENVWRCFELVTGRMVPAKYREDPFTCCA